MILVTGMKVKLSQKSLSLNGQSGVTVRANVTNPLCT